MASDKLKVFFKAWLDWATQQKVEDTRHFLRDQGLCACLSSFSRGDVQLHAELVSLLEADFKGNYQFPFEGKLPTYWESKRKQQLHLNPKRVNWVRTQLGVAK